MSRDDDGRRENIETREEATITAVLDELQKYSGFAFWWNRFPPKIQGEIETELRNIAEKVSAAYE